MFEKSSSWQRFGGSEKVLKMHLGYVPDLDFDFDESDDRRGLRLALAVAVVAHLVFFLAQLPASETILEAAPTRSVFVVQQVRFAPPPPKAEQLLPRKKEKRRIIPIPDPTPDEPEPIRLAEVEIPDVTSLEDVIFGIPEGPPADGHGSIGPVLQLTGDITPPEKIHYPSPRYTEEGRQARVQGVVILEAIVNVVGDVTAVKILKGLPFGLSEEAAETARQWKFRPARKAGQPVAVFLNLTIRFSLQ